MKVIFLFLIMFFLCFGASSQIELVSSFNSVDIGRNVLFSVKKDYNQHSILIGVKYNINKIIHDNQNNVFRKRFYAVNFREHLGLGLSYQYSFNLRSSVVKPFVFYDLQCTDSHTRNVMVLPYSFLPNGKFVYQKIIDFFGPTTALEHNLGFGMQVPLSKSFFLHQKIGWGVVNFINVDWRHLGSAKWEFGHLFNVGIGYRLNR